MTTTDKAEKKLRKLLERSGGGFCGFRITGYVGTCRGSSPVIKPVAKAGANDLILDLSGMFICIAPDCRQVLADATLDYQGGFMGRGLTLTWPHSPHCQCRCHGG